MGLLITVLACADPPSSSCEELTEPVELERAEGALEVDSDYQRRLLEGIAEASWEPVSGHITLALIAAEPVGVSTPDDPACSTPVVVLEGGVTGRAASEGYFDDDIKGTASYSSHDVRVRLRADLTEVGDLLEEAAHDSGIESWQVNSYAVRMEGTPAGGELWVDAMLTDGDITKIAGGEWRPL